MIKNIIKIRKNDKNLFSNFRAISEIYNSLLIYSIQQTFIKNHKLFQKNKKYFKK